MIVLLIHGLGRTPGSMFGLGAALRRDGHHTRYFGYSPTFESLPRVVNRLVRQLRRLAVRGQPVGLVGHSLGGLLLRKALLEVPELQVHRLLMLGTPNRPPRIAAYFWRWRLFRLVTRECGNFLASPDLIPKLPVPTVPYTIIAGTAGPRRSWLAFGDELNDGIVMVSETQITDADEPVLVPAFHSFLMDVPQVQAVVEAAFRTKPTPQDATS
jgi:pimeloyl-ACP methyl ester carboxylesterase